MGAVRDPEGHLVAAMQDEDGFRIWTPPNPPGATWDINLAAPKALSGDGRALAVGTIEGVAIYSTASQAPQELLKTKSPVVQVALAGRAGGLGGPRGRQHQGLGFRPDRTPLANRPRDHRHRRAADPLRGGHGRPPAGPPALERGGAHRGHGAAPVGRRSAGSRAGSAPRSSTSICSPARRPPTGCRRWSAADRTRGRPTGACSRRSRPKVSRWSTSASGRWCGRCRPAATTTQLEWRGDVLVVDAGSARAQAWDPVQAQPYGEPFATSPDPTAKFVASPDGQFLAVRGRVLADRAQPLGPHDRLARRAARRGGRGRLVARREAPRDGRQRRHAARVGRRDLGADRGAPAEGAHGRELAFSPDGTKLLSASWEGAVVASVETGELLERLPFDGLLSSVDWQAAGILMADNAGNVFVWQ